MTATQKAIAYADRLYKAGSKEWSEAMAAYNMGYRDGYFCGSNPCDEITEKQFRIDYE